MEKLSITSPHTTDLEFLRPSQPVAPVRIYSPNRPNQNESGALVYWRFIRRWKWLLLASGLIGIGFGYLVTLLQPTLYEARTSLEIQNLNDAFLNLKQYLPVSDGDGPSNTYGDIQTQIKLLQSDSVVNPVIDRALTAYNPEKMERAESGHLRTILGIAPSASSFPQVEAKRLYDNLKVRAVGQTRIVEVTATSASPELAADFLNQLTAQYIDLSSKARYEMGMRTSQSLSRLLDAERSKVRQSEDALQSYARTTGLVFTSAKKSIAEEKLSKLDDELAKAEETRIQAQARYQNTKDGTPDAFPDDLSHGSLGDYKAKLADLRRQVGELSATYTPDYYKIKRLEGQIASLQASIKGEEHDVVRRTESQYKEALGKEKLLASSYAHQSAVVSDLSQRAVQYDILQQELDANRKGYDELLSKVKDATVAATIHTNTARVVDAAMPPKNPFSPRPALNYAVGFLACSLVGFAWAFVRDHSNSSLREPGEGLQHLGLKELGAVVHVRPPLFRPGGALARRADLSERFSLVMESYRALVTSLLIDGDRSHRLLVVTSPGPGEGKTTVTANLGLMLAAIGRRVLLVDGDMRKRDLHDVFALLNERGLNTLLKAEKIEDQNLDSYVQKTSIPGLSVLSSGPVSPESAHLLHSAELPKLIELLKKDYDFVLVDTPPVLPVADARIIGQASDGIVLVARANQTSRDAAAAAHQRLAADGSKVLGLILNDWNPASSMFNHYAGYARIYSGAPE
jgi:succinoglycan biosynthesis transport protein ExoP